jgi:hypothetical protein
LEKVTIARRRNLKSIVLVIVLAYGLLMNINQTAFARSKSKKHRAYSYFDDGGKSTQENCDPEKKVPRKLKTEKELKKDANYLGSENVESELQAKDEGQMRKHFFSTQSACEKYLTQQQKIYELKKGEISSEKASEPEDADDADDEDDSEG